MSVRISGEGARAGGRGPAQRIHPGGRGPFDVEARVLAGQGLDALAGGRWAEAVETLTAAVEALAPTTDAYADAVEALSEALWWLGQVDEALAFRERAYQAWRSLQDDTAAARAAAWLAREYTAAVGNAAASRGWLARAGTLASTAPAAAGWVALTRAMLAADPRAQAPAAREALEHARTARDGDLEVLALARLGLAMIAVGRVAEGLGYVDEAMAAATGGDAGLSTLAALCCDLVVASDLSGEVERFAQWNDVVESLAARNGHPPLISFCATCCAEALAVAGDWPGAEKQLRGALAMLRRTGHRARCVAPAAKLADLLVHQGRLEEAEQVLGGDDSDPSLLVRARLALARGDTATAKTLAERHCRRLGGDSLLTAPALAFLVDVHLAAGELGTAHATADRLAAIAAVSGHRRTVGGAALARARVALASDDAAGARAALEEALDQLSAVAPGAVETAQAHLELARLRAGDAPRLAADEAKAAIAAFEAAGATHAVDAAAALLRSLGDRSRVGAKNAGVLTRREWEVLRLVAQGLTNAEVAERLFISPKTAGNHVSNILAKLGVRSRVEAAAYASLHADD